MYFVSLSCCDVVINTTKLCKIMKKYYNFVTDKSIVVAFSGMFYLGDYDGE